MTQDADVDLFVIGGGVNGAGIARDAAGRGLSVLLCEQGDLASATSSASSKLIHGGLRYLEYLQFRFVRDALIEREILLAAAPHIVWPLRFILPWEKELRPRWMIALGLFLYDRLAPRRRLAGSDWLDLRQRPEGTPLTARLATGFSYSDCAVDDARLVVLNALDARERGAQIETRTRFISAAREDGLWRIGLMSAEGTERTLTARALVNAGGPWASTLMSAISGASAGKALRLVRGGHIVTPKLYEGDHAYILQNPDGRVVFVLPFAQHFSLIGTTEIPFEGNPAEAAISDGEIAYLLGAVSRYFRKPPAPEDIVHSFSGVRPLYDDKAASASAASREFILDLHQPPGEAPLLSVLGGKITTYRRLAEAAIDGLASHLAPPRPEPWTAAAPLPGGDMEDGDFDLFLHRLQESRPWLPAKLALRLARAYGTLVVKILRGARGLSDLGEDFGCGLTRAEIDYLMDKEWASTAEDVLWRRSKLGLVLSPVEAARVQAYMVERAGAQTQEPHSAEPEPPPRD
ncbi:glycerol-3-phosphate dehydrogenase [Methylocapsa acidiphila]|uniref:glycerol-3-phosphate dehydrogenase n=1 Tax=Methylocapsa acidiphila TaxID=133552 RepID=UPI00041111FE|nr:glycerol-3-phosphate dehydrogenase [Methylocapsa acidiphila]